MTGNIALDVVIGLVFIYLLYSLFATVIMEIITAIFGLRARNLRYALRRMLMDEREFEGAFALIPNSIFKMLNTIFKIFGLALNLKNSKTFKSFYNQPTIKYLSGGGISNKPSYLTAQNFSKALIDTLKSLGEDSGNSPLEIIENGIKQVNAVHNKEKSLFWKFMAIIKNSVKKILNERFLKWLRKIRDGIKKIIYKWLAKEILDESHTRIHLESLLKDANNDLLKFKLFLEQWFEDTMARSTGWFKRRVQYILFIIGFILAVSFNANTLDIIKKLSNDPQARQHLVDMAINYSKDNKEIVDYVNQLKENKKNNSSNAGFSPNDSIVIDKIDSLISVSKSLKDDIYKAQNTISTNWRLDDSISIKYIDKHVDSTKTEHTDKKADKIKTEKLSKKAENTKTNKSEKQVDSIKTEHTDKKADKIKTANQKIKADKDSIYFKHQLFIQDTLRVNDGENIRLISGNKEFSLSKHTMQYNFFSRYKNKSFPYFSKGDTLYFLSEENKKKLKKKFSNDISLLLIGKEDALIGNCENSNGADCNNTIQIDSNDVIINKKKYIIFKRSIRKKVVVVVHKSIDTSLLKSIIPPVSLDLFNKEPKRIGIKLSDYKWKYVFAGKGLKFEHLWGYILTALAISLGSPFWFDLLNKLIKLRSAVKEEPKVAETNPKDNKLIKG